MMTTLRLVLHDGPQILERRFVAFPVRIGRDPENDCSILDAAISRCHATLDVEGDELVLRDLNSQNGTYFAEGATTRRLRGGTARFRGRHAEFAIGTVRVIANLESGPDLAATFPVALAPALHGAAALVRRACEPPALLANENVAPTVDRLLRVLDACFESFLSLRVATHDLEAARASRAGGSPIPDEGAAALLRWTQQTALALRMIEHGLHALQEQREHLVTEALDGVEAVLLELAPERLERETSDVGTEWPSAHACATWARYEAKHKKLVDHHRRRPNVLFGRMLADAVEERRRGDRSASEPSHISARRLLQTPQMIVDTPSDSAPEIPPSSQ